MESTEHFGIYFGYIRRLFQSRVSPFKAFVLRHILVLFFPEILNGHILKSRVLTLNHVTKIDFLDFSKILTSHFSIAHDDSNDIYDDMNRKIFTDDIA